MSTRRVRSSTRFYPFIHGVKDSDKPVNIQLALRGNPETLGPEVPRHFLSIFPKGDPDTADPRQRTHATGRLIVKQPIAMRVIVNRIWKDHFGTGIVDTPSNFGFGGERPTDPELLEYLAQDFVKNGMSIKKLQREIMLSSVYQLSTEDNKSRFRQRFGQPALLARQPQAHGRRADSRCRFWKSPAIWTIRSADRREDLTPDFKRRTVYGKVSRYKLDAYLQLFDFPPPNISAEKRFTTTVPLQRLFLMNSDFVQLEAEALAKRVAAEPNNRARIAKTYELAMAAIRTKQEIKLGLDYLHTEPMKEYEENKNKPKAGRRRRRRPWSGAAAADGRGGATRRSRYGEAARRRRCVPMRQPAAMRG